MRTSTHFWAAFLAASSAIATPIDTNAVVDPTDGPLPSRNITACTNMFTQPNATPQTYEKVDGTYGTGKYKPAWYTTDASLPDHTLYLPKTIPAGVKLPVVLWANGGCGGNGVAWLSPLVEWASHGMLVIADGAPNGRSRDTAALMKKALDWVNANAGKGAYAQVDGKRVGISGQSCGGLVAYEVEGDKRVTAVGIFNSGALNAAQRQVVPKFSKPIAYFLGGKTDIAYAQGTADYNALPKGLPAWKGNVESGHGGTFCRPAGGEYGKAGSQWWKWQLRGDPSAKAFFTEPGAKDMGWQAVSQNLDKAPVPEALPGN